MNMNPGQFHTYKSLFPVRRTQTTCVLHAWFEKRQERDVVVKLHTGGGKTLVGLLMAQSTLNETAEPVLYLASTVQLVNQTIEKAQAIGINAVAYERGQPLNDDFVNANAIMVGTYKALFNGLMGTYIKT